MILILVVIVLLALSGLFFIVTRRQTSPNIKLENAHVLITGGSSGIGLSAAKYFAERCAKLTIIARDKTKLAQAKELLSGRTAEVLTISCDLSGSYTVIESAIEEAVDTNGPIDILFNCAGNAVAREFERSDPKIIEDMIRVNYFSCAYVTRAVIPKMIKSGRGIVVLTSSQAGQVGVYGFTPYSASKFALRGFAEALLMELRPHGISVSMVFPPDTDTPGYAVEQLGKPAATHKISQASGLFTADEVATAVIPQILSGKFFCTVGFDGWLLATLTAGMAPSDGVLQSFAESMLCGILRLVAYFYQWSWGRIVRDSITVSSGN